jgi:hypothetical protein
MSDDQHKSGAPAQKAARKGNKIKLLWALYALCTVLVLLDLPIHRHAETGFDGNFGFYGFYGFIASVVLVLAARYVLRPIVKRPEGYYDD